VPDGGIALALKPIPFDGPPQFVRAFADGRLVAGIRVEVFARDQHALDQEGRFDEIGAVIQRAEGHRFARGAVNPMRKRAVKTVGFLGEEIENPKRPGRTVGARNKFAVDADNQIEQSHSGRANRAEFGIAHKTFTRQTGDRMAVFVEIVNARFLHFANQGVSIFRQRRATCDGGPIGALRNTGNACHLDTAHAIVKVTACLASEIGEEGAIRIRRLHGFKRAFGFYRALNFKLRSRRCVPMEVHPKLARHGDQRGSRRKRGKISRAHGAGRRQENRAEQRKKK